MVVKLEGPAGAGQLPEPETAPVFLPQQDSLGAAHCQSLLEETLSWTPLVLVLSFLLNSYYGSCFIHPIKLSSWFLHSCGRKMTSESSHQPLEEDRTGLKERRPGFTGHSAGQWKAIGFVLRPKWVLIPVLLALTRVPGLMTQLSKPPPSYVQTRNNKIYFTG